MAINIIARNLAAASYATSNYDLAVAALSRSRMYPKDYIAEALANLAKGVGVSLLNFLLIAYAEGAL